MPTSNLSLNYTRLSKTIALALRHKPWLFELELDDEGWVPVEHLLDALRQRRDQWADLTEADLVTMMGKTDKPRYELRAGKIRALYGHSLPGKLAKVPAEPPDVLYHGTSPGAVEAIRKTGLQPMSRQYVHLSVERETAQLVGERKAQRPVMLVVRAAEAHRNGVVFYRGNDKVWLADHVPPEFITFPSNGGV